MIHSFISRLEICLQPPPVISLSTSFFQHHAEDFYFEFKMKGVSEKLVHHFYDTGMHWTVLNKLAMSFYFKFTNSQRGGGGCRYLSEVGNVTSKCKGVTRYRSSHVLKVITFSSDNGTNVDRAITLRRDNSSYVPRAITIRNNNFDMLS